MDPAMAKTIVFVHGTGVRGDAYKAACQLIETKLATYAPEVKLVQCLWGDTLGASLKHEGKSIPTYGSTRSPGPSAEDERAALWFLLLQDPTFELHALKEADAAPLQLPPDEELPGIVLHQQFAALRDSDALAQELVAMGLVNKSDRPAARAMVAVMVDQLTSGAAYKAVETCSAAGTPRHREVLARALVAGIEKFALDEGLPVLDAAHRDALVKRVEALFGHDTRGVLATLLSPFGGLAMSLGTWQARRKRTALTDSIYPAAGDILVYQARGAGIRDFIRKCIANVPDDEVYLLAHSLGGIACVEMLAEACPPNVKRLITFGSQAPFLYELGALGTLPSDSKLPGYFPPWSNFYDLNDQLSYIGENLFPDQVTDHQIESGLAFPAAHSAYLNNTQFWLVLAALINDV
jgi:hypothetical protein